MDLTRTLGAALPLPKGNEVPFGTEPRLAGFVKGLKQNPNMLLFP